MQNKQGVAPTARLGNLPARQAVTKWVHMFTFLIFMQQCLVMQSDCKWKPPLSMTSCYYIHMITH